jgi:lysosomal Pro-X carboxypeptidase
MWNLGLKMNALIVFAEHRYEGKSLPPLNGVEDCVAYGTTAQAIADYRQLVLKLKDEYNAPNAPIIAFGGSYGGMLAGWARIVAPDVFTGSIASSAPVRMIMTGTSENYKGGWEAIARGISAAGGATDYCFTNFRGVRGNVSS